MTDEANANNPFAGLEGDLRAQETLQKALNAISRARISLITKADPKSVFFSHLALKLKVVPRPGCGTAAVDGEHLFFEPSFIAELTPAQLTGVLIHEVLHCAFGHFARRQARDPQAWNVACDLAINQIVLDSGYELPDGCCVAGKRPFEKHPNEASAEEHYALLPTKPQGGGSGDGQGQGQPFADPGGSGGVIDAKDQSVATEQAADWDVAVKTATEAAKQRGTLPQEISRLVGQIEDSKIDWRAELRDFLTVRRPERNCWSTPNRRFFSRGFYLPTLTGEGLGHVAVAIDTSGSIDGDQLAEFAGELTGILGNSPTKLTVIWCDCRIGRVDEYDDLSREDLRLDPVGGGGTSHLPVFDYVSGLDDQPEVLVCLTDLETDFPKDSDVPTLWVSTGRRGLQAPFGKTIELRA